LSVESRPGARPWYALDFAQGRLAMLARHRTLVSVGGLSLLFFAAFLVRYWVARQIVSPWIVSDEYTYARAARDAAANGLSGLFSDIPTTFPGIYPRLISPAWMLFDSAGAPYAAAKALNVLLMTFAGVLVYVLGRRFLERRFALTAAVLTLLLPPLLYSSVLRTENAFFPAFTLSMLAITAALERPTTLRQLLVFVPIALTWLVRVQAIVLLGILPLAVALKFLFDARALPGGAREAVRRARAYLPWAIVYATGGVVYLVYANVQGKPLNSVLGGYYGVTEVEYSLRTAAEWITYHFGELMLLVAVAPASALIIVVGHALRRGTDTTAAERAFLAAAVAALVVVPAQVGLYASHFISRVEERNMFHVAPLMLLAFALWLQRGMPRPARLAAVAAIVPIALLLTLPLETLLNIGILSDTFSLIPFLSVVQHPSGGLGAAQVLLALGALIAGIVFATVPRRIGILLVPLLVGSALLVITTWAFRSIDTYAANFRASAGAGDDVSWIDRRVGPNATVGAVFGGDADPDRARSVLLHTWFWNRSLKVVFKTVPVDLLSLPQHNATVLPDGVVSPSPPRDMPEYMVADLNTPIAGQVIARTGSHVLYRVAPPLRIASQTEGLYADGWMSASASETVLWTPTMRPGKVKVVISRASWAGPDVPGKVRITIQRPGATAGTPPLATASTVIHSHKERAFTLKAPAPPYQVVVGIDPTFSPSQFGFSDPRQLGAQVSFTPLPR
jgi:hypothetical protein